MNIVNEMVTNLQHNKDTLWLEDNEYIVDKERKNEKRIKNAGSHIISWQLSPGIIFSIGISLLLYIMWAFNTPEETKTAGSTISFEKTTSNNSIQHVFKKKIAVTAPSQSQSAKKHHINALTQLNANDTVALNKILSNDPSHIEARKTLVGIYINEKKLTMAKEILQEGIKKTPEVSVFYQWLARIQMEQRQFEKASALLLAGSQYAKKGEYFALMALAQQNTPKFKQAISSYRQALNYKPTESKWWLGLGIVLEKTNNWKGAKDAYLASLKPENLPFFLHNQANERLIFIEGKIALMREN